MVLDSKDLRKTSPLLQDTKASRKKEKVGTGQEFDLSMQKRLLEIKQKKKKANKRDSRISSSSKHPRSRYPPIIIVVLKCDLLDDYFSDKQTQPAK